MTIRFHKIIEQKEITKDCLEVIRKEFLNRNAKTTWIANDRVEFETKSMFHYFNFHLFSYIDHGYVAISAVTEHQVKVEYNIVTYRAWLVAAIALFMSFYAFGSIGGALIFASLIFLGIFFFIKLSHYYFLKGVIRKICK